MCNAICISAQEITPAKQINAIKRDSSYVYAEATDVTVPQAYDAANVQLMLQIKEYIVSQGMKDDDILIKDKAAKCERIEMARGDKYRVFVYVKKTDIMSAQSVTIIPKSALQAMGSTPPSIQPTTVEPEKELVEEPKVMKSNNDLTTKENEVAVHEAIGQLKDWQQTLIGNLMNCTDMDDCLTYLNKMKVQNKVKKMGGKSDTPRNSQQTFYAIFSPTGKLKALLGKEDNGSRMNYMSKHADQLTNYSTDDQIWFTLSNF